MGATCGTPCGVFPGVEEQPEDEAAGQGSQAGDLYTLGPAEEYGADLQAISGSDFPGESNTSGCMRQRCQETEGESHP